MPLVTQLLSQGFSLQFDDVQFDDVQFNDAPFIGDAVIEEGVWHDPSPFMGPGMDPGGGAFTVIPALIGIVFVIGVIFMIFKLIQAGHTFAENSSSPELTVPAKLVAKRTTTSGGGNDTHVTTTHYATFEVASGERMELKVNGREYGQLAEGDEGTLTHQGTWYRKFERSRVLPLDGTWEAPGGASPLPPPPSQN
ncbi:DUF2500 domain-containing protein [Ornithinimicrobium sp. Y1847]|uniref:DUF2500 domain-containing protein n=1 Tax=Ornithinimicrobium sp. Y1847 TaxID=3405419 RepID=UPI003B679E5C